VLAAAVAAGDPPVVREPGQVGRPQLSDGGGKRRLAAEQCRVRHDQVHRLGKQQLLPDVLVVHSGDLDRVVGVLARRGVPRRGPCAVGGLVPEDQRHVHIPGAQHPQCLRRLGLGQPQVHARMPLVQYRRGGGHDGAERGGEHRQPQPPRPQAGEHRELVLRRVQAAEHLDGPLGEQPPRIGQPDAAPGPLDELRAGLRLKPGEVMTDRRLRVVQRVGGRGDRSVPGHGDQHAQPRHIQHGPTIDAIDRSAQMLIPG